MPLSDLAIRSAKPGEKDIRLFDGGGMFLLITPKGAKWWRFKYRFAGKNKLLSFGVYPEVSLKEAREQRDKARELLRRGVDPSTARKRQKLAQRASVENAFENIAREWIEQQSERWTPDHAARVLQSLEQDAFPSLGARPVNEIETPEILDMVRAIERRGGPGDAAVRGGIPVCSADGAGQAQSRRRPTRRVKNTQGGTPGGIEPGRTAGTVAEDRSLRRALVDPLSVALRGLDLRATRGATRGTLGRIRHGAGRVEHSCRAHENESPASGAPVLASLGDLGRNPPVDGTLSTSIFKRITFIFAAFVGLRVFPNFPK